jgi:hypothetical protein
MSTLPVRREVLQAEFVGEIEPTRMPLPVFVAVGLLRGALSALPIAVVTLLLMKAGVFPS